MYKTISTQITTIVHVFQADILEQVFKNFVYDKPGSDPKAVPLLVVPETILSTKNIFDRIDLGQMKKNTWFLDAIHMYNIVKNVPIIPYVLPYVNIGSSKLIPNDYSLYDFNGPRPLTLHEVVTLAFHFPSIFNEKISGIQAYGSRFANSKSDVRNADTDDTLEIYRKGNPEQGLLKLAREHHRYHEDTKIIPYAYGL